MSVRPKTNREGEAPAEPVIDTSDLPEGWAIATLLEVGAWRSGGTPSRSKPEYFGNGIPWVKSGDLPDGPITRTEEQITPLGLNNSAAKVMPPGTICMALYGATIGKLGTMTFEAATNQATANLIPDKRVVDGQYVFHYLMSERQNFINLGQGGAQPNISQEIVRNHSITLAPLAEQRRIVGKLELLLGKVSSSQQRLSRVPGLLKRFRQSVLAAACSGKLTAEWREGNDDVESASELLERLQAERRKTWSSSHPNRRYQEPAPLENDDLEAIPDSWIWTNFDQCASEITVGHVGSMRDRYVDSGIAFLRSQNVRPLRFDPAGLVRIPKDFQAELTKSKLNGGEILVVRSGANTGDCCVFPRCMPEANCADLVITRPLSGLCAEYGAMYVASPIGQAAIGLRQTGIAQPHFNIGAMRVKPFPLPPLSEQQEIVRRVEKLFTFADQIESRLKKAQEQVDRLTPSLLAKAFRGELVPTEAELARRENRSYEPASELLARIQTEREHSGEPSKVTTKRARAATRK
jgi:type I restriction enzyme S subunit